MTELYDAPYLDEAEHALTDHTGIPGVGGGGSVWTWSTVSNAWVAYVGTVPDGWDGHPVGTVDDPFNGLLDYVTEDGEVRYTTSPTEIPDLSLMELTGPGRTASYWWPDLGKWSGSDFGPAPLTDPGFLYVMVFGPNYDQTDPEPTEAVFDALVTALEVESKTRKTGLFSAGWSGSLETTGIVTYFTEPWTVSVPFAGITAEMGDDTIEIRNIPPGTYMVQTVIDYPSAGSNIAYTDLGIFGPGIGGDDIGLLRRVDEHPAFYYNTVNRNMIVTEETFLGLQVQLDTAGPVTIDYAAIVLIKIA